MLLRFQGYFDSFLSLITKLHLRNNSDLILDVKKKNLRRKYIIFFLHIFAQKKVQVGKDQEKAQSEKDSHSKNRGGKKPN